MRKTGVFFILLLLLLSLIPFSMFNVGADSQFELTLNGNGDLSEWDGDDYTNLLHTGGSQATSFSSTYVESTYDATDHTAQAGTINEVYVVAYFSSGGNDDGGDFRLSLRVDESSYYSDVWVIDDSTQPGTLVGYEWSTNPDDSQPWEWSDIDSLQLGISGKYHNAIDQIRCDYLHGYVNYTADLTPTTNTPSNVEESTATLSGTTAFDASGATCGFWYNTSTTSSSDYGNNVTVSGTFDNSETFTEGLTGLISGEYYYCRAWSFKTGIGFFNDSTGEQYFLTKPYKPSNLTITTYQNQLNITWDNATTGDVTQTNVVRYKTTGYPTGVTDGTLLYNGSTNSTTLPNYTPGTTYYFTVWTYIQASGSPLLFQYSDSGDSNSSTAPTKPTNLVVTQFNESHITLGWTKGTGSTVITRNTTSYPSTPDSGTKVYNSTGQSYNDVGLIPSTTYYYRAWNWNGTGYSDGYVNVTQTTSPQYPRNVTSDVTVTGGSTMDIQIDWDIGTGANRTVIRRSYSSQPVLPTDGTSIYNDTGTTHTDTGITEPPYYTLFSYNTSTGLYSRGVNVSWYVVWVECYNESDGSAITDYTVFFTNDEGTETYQQDDCTNPTLINTSDIPIGDDILLQINAEHYDSAIYYLDIEVTGVYYIDAFLRGTNNSELYLMNVLDEIGNPLSDVKVQVKKYINETFGYQNITIEYTDGNGQFSIYLTPDVLYRFKLEKTGYESQISNWVPTDQILTHTFTLLFVDSEPVEPSTPIEDIVFTFELSGTTLYVNYTDSMSETIDTTVYIWMMETSTGNSTLLQTDIRTGENNFSFTVAGANISNSYKAILYYNHSTFGYQTITLVIHGYYTPGTGFTKINTLLTVLIGSNPLGWGNFLMFFFLLAVFHQADSRDAGKWLVLIGGLFIFINIFMGTIFSIAGGVIPTLFIAVGVLQMWKDGRKTTT